MFPLFFFQVNKAYITQKSNFIQYNNKFKIYLNNTEKPKNQIKKDQFTAKYFI